MPQLPHAPALELAPDWLCEVLSSSTSSIDRTIKLPIYAAAGVAHVWLVDAEAMTVEIFRLDGDSYRFVATFAGDAAVRAEPFGAVILDLGALWSR